MLKANPDVWRGYFAAVVTPFSEDGLVDDDAFCNNIRRLVADGVHGVVVAGTTGEYWALTDDERERLFRLASSAAERDITVVGGVTASTPDRVVRLARAAEEAGLAGVMVAPPPGVLPKRRELIRHFAAIDDAVDIDIMIYNYQERYGVNMPPDLIAELADLKHIVAVKESCSDFSQQIETLRLAGDRLAIMAGWPGLRAVPSIAMGCHGLVGSIEAQVLGSEARSLWECAAAGDWAAARSIQLRFIRLHWTVTAAVGTAPAQLKAAMNITGRPGGFPRLPVLPLSAEEYTVVEGALRDLGALTPAAATA